MGNGFFDNVPPVSPQDHGWPTDLAAGHTHELPVYDEHEPRHEAPRSPFQFRWWQLGLPLLIAALLVAYVAWEQQSTNLNARPADPTQSAQPQPQTTRTVRVTPPAVTVQAAPRPAETVYVTRTAVTVVTKTAEPKPAATVTVETTKTVTAPPPEPAPAVHGD